MYCNYGNFDKAGPVLSEFFNSSWFYETVNFEVNA